MEEGIVRDLIPSVLSRVKANDHDMIRSFAQASPELFLAFLQTRELICVNALGGGRCPQLEWLARHHADQFARLNIVLECGFRDWQTAAAHGAEERPIPSAIVAHARTLIINSAFGYGRRYQDGLAIFWWSTLILPGSALPHTVVFRPTYLVDWMRVFGHAGCNGPILNGKPVLIGPCCKVTQYPSVKRFCYMERREWSEFTFDHVIRAWFPNAEIVREVPEQIKTATVIEV